MFTGYILIPTASGQGTGGGVDHPGTWYVGEGLKQGDLFSYNLCHIDYKDCTEFQIDWWIEDEITVGAEQKWLAQVVIFDGNKIIKGNMVLDKIAPEPTSSSSNLVPYANAYKNSIVWLGAFANANEPKAFSDPSWGKFPNIGGVQIVPTALEQVTVPAGTFDTVLIQWNIGGTQSKVWVVDGFPYPIKALTFVVVTTGIPPRHYQFELLETNFEQPVVGGELIPIEQTSLILAGAQTFSWMIPVTLSVLGIGLFVVSRKSENP